MTNESKTIGSIGRGPEFHYSRVPETKTGEAESGLTKRAWNIAEYMVKIARLGAAPAADEDRRKMGNLLTVAGQSAGITFANVGELIDCEDPRVEGFRNDFIDGVGIGTMWGVGVVGTRPEVAAAMNSGNPEEIDLALGIGTAGIMKGVGKVVRENLVTDQYLVRRLNALKMAGASQIAISRALNEITLKYSEGQIGSEREAEMIMTYLTEMVRREAEKARIAAEREAAEARKREDVPRTETEQLVLVRGMLERLEASGRHTRDYQLGGIAAQLEGWDAAGLLESKVGEEVRSRLKLIDCYVYMKKSNGWINAPKSGADLESPTIGAAATLANGNNGHVLDGESIEFFLKTSANGIPVREAWDMYQDINLNYREWVRKVEQYKSLGVGSLSGASKLKTAVDNDPSLGTVDISYWTDGNAERRLLVDEYVIELLRGNMKVDLKTAKKAWELAQKLALATGENSIFNAALTGNDEMAEDLYLRLYRKSRDDKGRPRGPQITLNDIEGVGNSWLRKISELKEAGDRFVPLYARDIKAEEIKSGDYVYHNSVWWSVKIHPLRDLLLNRQPDPKELLSINFLQTAQDYFAQADPPGEGGFQGKKKLKMIWIKGVLDLAASNGDLGWTSADYGKFKRLATRMSLNTQEKVFVSPESWNEMEKIYHPDRRLAKLHGKMAVRDFILSMGGMDGKR